MKLAILAFKWFLGKNSLNQIIYDESTGGCYDGLGEFSINLNQGAESSVSYLLARLTFEEFERNMPVNKTSESLISQDKINEISR